MAEKDKAINTWTTESLKVRPLNTENNYWKKKYGYGSYSSHCFANQYVTGPLSNVTFVNSCAKTQKYLPILKTERDDEFKNNGLRESYSHHKENYSEDNLNLSLKRPIFSPEPIEKNESKYFEKTTQRFNLLKSTEIKPEKRKMVQLKVSDMFCAKKVAEVSKKENANKYTVEIPMNVNNTVQKFIKNENEKVNMSACINDEGIQTHSRFDGINNLWSDFEDIDFEDLEKIRKLEMEALGKHSEIKTPETTNNKKLKKCVKSKKDNSKRKKTVQLKNDKNKQKKCKKDTFKLNKARNLLLETGHPTKLVKSKIQFTIIELSTNEMFTLRNCILENSVIEIGFTILFSENFCQMEKVPGTTDKTCEPCSLMFAVQFSSGDQKFYILNLKKLSSSDIKAMRVFIDIVMTSNIRKICYEAQEFIMLVFDLLKLSREDICLKWDIVDPKIGFYLLDPDDPPQTFSSILSKSSMDVSFKMINKKCIKQRTAYCLTNLSKCCQKMHEILIKNDLWKVFISMETRIITILSAMELRGICIDSLTLLGMQSVLNNQLKHIEKEAFRAAGKCFLLNSPAQLRTILFDDLKLDVKSKLHVKTTSKLGAKSTSEPVLKSLVHLHPLPGLILNYRNIHKAKSTFVDSILQQSDNGVIRTMWEQTSAATGRIASRNPNLQAIPKHPLVLDLYPKKDFEPDTLQIRNAFIPRPGYTFVAADFQHIECRVFAHFTRDNMLIEIFKQDIDIFTCLAAKWMNKNTIEDVTPEDRYKTKHLVYALMYGAGQRKLAEILNTGLLQTSQIISKFLDAFPSLKLFKENILKQCRNDNGVLHSLYGRIRRFKNISAQDLKQRAYAERQAINFVIQGSAADICKLAMIATEHRLSNLPQNLGHHLLLQIHDELMWEVPDSNVSTFIDVIKEVMQESGHFCGKLSVPLPVSVVKGKSWGQLY